MPKYTVVHRLKPSYGNGRRSEWYLGVAIRVNGQYLMSCPSEYTAKRVARAMNIVYGKKEKA